MARIVVRARTEGFRGADTFREVATKASTDPGTVAAIGRTADLVADNARGVLGAAPTSSPWQAREKSEVLSSVRVISANSRFTRNKIAPGSTIEVYLAVSHHPATVRWENGTKRTSATHFMLRGKEAGRSASTSSR